MTQPTEVPPNPGLASPDIPASTHAQESSTVIAVLVTHDGGDYLPRTLAALANQTRLPDVLVVVDTGSLDNTSALVHASDIVDRVVELPRTTGFGAAVHAGLAEASQPTDWIWVLHDDSAPDPDCLAALLTAVANSTSLSIVGPKVLGWDDPRRLLEVGVSMNASGRRETGLERREQDQGQHDGLHDVLGVGSAASLIRWELWDALGGYDLELSFFREDVDLGWRANRAGHRVAVVTAATVRHAEATSRGRRALDAGDGRVPLVDRASGLLVLLGNGRRFTFPMTYPLQWLRLLFGTVLRVAGFLLVKAPVSAVDEWRAMTRVLFRPDRVLAARRLRYGSAELRVVSRRHLKAFFPGAGTSLRHALDVASGLRIARQYDDPSVGASLLESGPADDDEESMVGGPSWWRRTLRRPGVVLFLSLTAVALVAWRGLYAGGSLFGGALLPSPSGASDLFAGYLAAWHPVATGSAVASPAYVVALWLVSGVVLGKASTLVSLLLAMAVPLAAVSVYAASVRLPLSKPLRWWLAAGYGLSPVMLAAVAQGRLGTVVVAILLPWFAVAGGAAITTHERVGTWSAAAQAGVLLAVMTAFAPVMWWLAVVASALVGWQLTHDRMSRWRLAAMVLAAWILCVPWSLRLITDPALNLLEAGLAVPRSPAAAPWHVLVFSPGGSGSPPLLLGALLSVLVVAAVWRAGARQGVRVALAGCALGLAAAVVTSTVTVDLQSAAQPVPTWPGPALVVATAAALVAVVLAARGSRRRLRGERFGWQQPALVALTLCGVVAIASLGGWWLVRGAAGPIGRGNPQVLPAFVAAAADQPDRVRTLVLQQAGGQLDFTLLRERSPELGDGEVQPPASGLADLRVTVSELASGRGGDAVTALRRYAVQFVLVSAPVDPQLESTLDSVPGLVRVSNPGSDALWQIEKPAARLVLAAPDSPTSQVTVVPSGEQDAQALIAASDVARTLWLAEHQDPNWKAQLGDQPLAGAADQWQQTFPAPQAAGSLQLTYDGSARVRWLLLQLIVFVTVVVVAIPSRRRLAPEDES